MKKLKNKYLKSFLDNGLNLVLLSVLTGLFAGVVVTFYNMLAHWGEEGSRNLYSLVFEHPAYIPLLFLGLAAGAFVIGTLVKAVPMIRGSGIPQIEGAARGVIRFKWYVTMCSMFAASLACICLGLSAGAEGPSLQLGGCAGDATSAILRRGRMVRRLQIAGGASAGLAVAFNAPITGMVFALEEAFRSFSPQVFICSAISVVTALFTRNAIRPAFGEDVTYAFTGFRFNEFGLASCGWAALAAVVAAMVGVAFYFAVFAVKKLFKRIRFFGGTGKYLIPFLLAGAFGLITPFAMGGGGQFINKMGTGGTGIIGGISVLGAGLLISLAIILAIKFVASVLAMGCGVPCGVFIPMLAIGAGVGGVLSVLFQKAGMPAQYGDYLVIICMAAFFTSVVKAPITGVVMVFELTGQFTNFLPALLGIAIGYLAGIVFRTEPIYEKCLDMYIAEEGLYEGVNKERVTVVVQKDSFADGKTIRSIIWPSDGLVVEKISEDGTHTVPDGLTMLRRGDTIVFEGETRSREALIKYLYDIVGKPAEEGEAPL